MNIDVPLGTVRGWGYVDRFFGDPMDDLDRDFENGYVAELFARHSTFPAFLPGIGECASGLSTCFTVPDGYEWVALSPSLVVSRKDYQARVDAVREVDERYMQGTEPWFYTQLYDVTYWLARAVSCGAEEVVIGQAVVNADMPHCDLHEIAALDGGRRRWEVGRRP
jgi:hypothetical protein